MNAIRPITQLTNMYYCELIPFIWLLDFILFSSEGISLDLTEEQMITFSLIDCTTEIQAQTFHGAYCFVGMSLERKCCQRTLALALPCSKANETPVFPVALPHRNAWRCHLCQAKMRTIPKVRTTQVRVCEAFFLRTF